ncbi:hypothetical protein BC940DRAFT_239533 [Gongronella butleri]|nr:hypothetical protein BC940DRAFT_239533 [Gongronella butleri]
MIGQCILVDEAAFKMFQRVSIVFFRQRDPTQSNELQSAILSKINRRRYPDYVHCRSTDVWPTIDALDQYIDAFWLQQNFEQQVEATTMERRYYKTENTKEMDPALRARWLECWKLCENVIGVWDDLLLAYDMQPQRDNERPYFMRRFEAGYLYTHMIEHGSKILGRLHEYELEATILRKLLEQRRYRNGKRGKWYDRLALIQSTHLKEPAVRPRKKMALQTCIDGVQDPRVHQIHMYSLHRRIHKLERDLCIPKREQHDFSYMALQKPSERVIYGMCERLTDPRIGSKSVWRSDNGAEISVEEVAIEYYQKQGYKGLHTENGVISMLYTLLFWDIIFAPIPGAFETPYQTAPLDLESDAFYVERVSLIHDRVELVSQSLQAALDLIKTHDDQNRPLNTMCTGVNWNYALQDLLEIAECIGAHSLSCLSSLLAEEYGHRRGGMPDLCCWDYENKKCLFAEIKGPSDTLSETQKMWLHTLSNIGIPVEVCHVAVWKGEDVLDEGN